MNKRSVKELRKTSNQPQQTCRIISEDGKPLPANVPPFITIQIWLGKDSEAFTLEDAAHIILADFGEAFAPATEQKLGRELKIPQQSCPPEAFFEPEQPLSYASDIWPLGVAIWEILGLQGLFSDPWNTKNETVEDHLNALGATNFPKKWQEIWIRDAAAQASDYQLPRRPEKECEEKYTLDQLFERGIQKWRRKEPTKGIFEEDEKAEILALMRGMLCFDPEKRMTIEQVLESEWMVKWALPAARKADECIAGSEQATTIH